MSYGRQSFRSPLTMKFAGVFAGVDGRGGDDGEMLCTPHHNISKQHRELIITSSQHHMRVVTKGYVPSRGTGLRSNYVLPNDRYRPEEDHFAEWI